jgi:hypothetical protein
MQKKIDKSKYNKDDLINFLVLDGSKLQIIIENNKLEIRNNKKLIKEQSIIIDKLIKDSNNLYNSLLKLKSNIPL